MAWYYGTFSCGHEGRVNILGKVAYRRRKADNRFSGLCEKCWAKSQQDKRDAEYQRALRLAEEMELPPLEGTEKQQRWGVMLRQKMIELIESPNKSEKEEYPQEKIEDALDYVLSTHTKATWFIENRERCLSFRGVAEFILPLQEKEEKEQDEIKLEEEILREATVYPESTAEKVPARIKFFENKVTAWYERNEKFYKVLKSLGYTWTNQWEREISETTGSAADRAAELGNALLNAGFPICILDAEVREKAVKGDFIPEHKRWIYRRGKGEYKNWFAIRLNEHDNELYKRARSLPKSKWDSPSVMVRPEYFIEVEEFAELFGFKFTNRGNELLQIAKKFYGERNVRIPAKKEKLTEKDGLLEILNSGDDILDDLKD